MRDARIATSDSTGMGAGSNLSTLKRWDQVFSNQRSSSADTASSSNPQP